MKVGILGTGAIGGTIAKKLVMAGHKVKICNTAEYDSLKERVQELGAYPAKPAIQKQPVGKGQPGSEKYSLFSCVVWLRQMNTCPDRFYGPGLLSLTRSV